MYLVKAVRLWRAGGQLRLIPPPRVGRWQIWAVSRYPQRGERLVGRYRSRRVAGWIAGRLPAVGGEYATYEVRRVYRGAAVTGTYSDPMKLCPACARRRCEDRGPDCDTDCECPCAVMGGPEDVAAFARELRKVPPIRGML